MENKKYVFLYNDQDWYLMIDSKDTLTDYLNMAWNIREEELVNEVENMKEQRHLTSVIISRCQQLASIKGTSILQEYETLKEIQSKEMLNQIQEGKTLYINSIGGYTTHLDTIINRYESEELCWPVFKEEDIRIKKWPRGIHYYAYIGPIQVKERNIRKWNTEEEARKAAIRYITKKREE